MKRAGRDAGRTSRAEAEVTERTDASPGTTDRAQREDAPSDPLADLLLGPRNPGALAPARLEAARRRARRLRSFLDAGGAHLAPRELRAAAIDADHQRTVALPELRHAIALQLFVDLAKESVRCQVF